MRKNNTHVFRDRYLSPLRLNRSYSYANHTQFIEYPMSVIPTKYPTKRSLTRCPLFAVRNDHTSNSHGRLHVYRMEPSWLVSKNAFTTYLWAYPRVLYTLLFYYFDGRAWETHRLYLTMITIHKGHGFGVFAIKSCSQTCIKRNSNYSKHISWDLKI